MAQNALSFEKKYTAKVYFVPNFLADKKCSHAKMADCLCENGKKRRDQALLFLIQFFKPTSIKNFSKVYNNRMDGRCPANRYRSTSDSDSVAVDPQAVRRVL